MKHRACVWCGEPTSRDDLEVNLFRPAGEAITLRWHLERGCADADPLHIELADGLALPDGVASDTAARSTYMRIVIRAREKGPEHLRRVVDVVRDFPTGRFTLKGPGLAWGALSTRPPRPAAVNLARPRRRSRSAQ